MAGSQISTSVSIIDSLSGFMALSLTEYNTSAAAAIAAGSKVEIAGAFFQFSSDETPTGWAAIVTATTAYIALTASGTAGSQVVNAGYVSTAPTWRDDLQGWYASAASSVRIVASVYKSEVTSYYPKILMEPLLTSNIKIQHGVQVFVSSGSFVVPNNVTSILVSGCAAGGNGGNAYITGTYGNSGGGGGGGEVIWKKLLPVTPNTIIKINIGSVGSPTTVGTISLNYGANGSNATSGSGGAGGAGGALGSGSFAGGAGGLGRTNGSDSASAGTSTEFCGGGIGGRGGGGGASLGHWLGYLMPTAGTESGFGTYGSFGGGGGGGGGAPALGGNGGNGGYGSGGGGGGGAGSGVIGTPGTGGPAIILLEW